jgi:hypothetical protein
LGNFPKIGGGGDFWGSPKKRPIKYCNNCPVFRTEVKRLIRFCPLMYGENTVFLTKNGSFLPHTPQNRLQFSGEFPVPRRPVPSRVLLLPEERHKMAIWATLLVLETYSERHPDRNHPKPTNEKTPFFPFLPQNREILPKSNFSSPYFRPPRMLFP